MEIRLEDWKEKYYIMSEIFFTKPEREVMEEVMNSILLLLILSLLRAFLKKSVIRMVIAMEHLQKKM